MLKMQCHVHARLPARSWQRTLGHWAERRHLFLAREIQGEGHTCEKSNSCVKIPVKHGGTNAPLNYCDTHAVGTEKS